MDHALDHGVCYCEPWGCHPASLAGYAEIGHCQFLIVETGIDKMLCMSDNKKLIERYMDGFNKFDHEQILSCMTDDVVWEMPGFFRHTGKEAFDKEIENDAFEGRPVITVTRMTEEKDVVIAEGTVLTRPKGGDTIPMVFCDVFEMRGGKISKLISYIAPVK